MTQEQALDVLVIGAGSGGYIASIRAGQLGLKVACVEANPYADPKGEPRPGGTCLNVGCIPSKALLSSSEEFEKIEKHAAAHGIRVAGATMDVPAMIARKDAIVTKMAQGIEYLFRKNKVAYLKGRANILGRADAGFRVSITRAGSTQEVTARNLVIATGSLPRQLPGIAVDNMDVCDNSGALDWRSVPRRIDHRCRSNRPRIGFGMAQAGIAGHRGRSVAAVAANVRCRCRARNAQAVDGARDGLSLRSACNGPRAGGRWRAKALLCRCGRSIAIAGLRQAGGRGGPCSDDGGAGA